MGEASQHNARRPLQGKAALVTGSSRGIGAAIARRLAADGARVALHYAERADAAETLLVELRATGGTALALRADLAVPGEAERLVADAARALGGLDILVNNAGTGSFGPLAKMAPADIRRVLEVNATATILACHEAVAHLRPGGRIVNVGSVIVDMPVPLRAAYAASKGAVHAFTQVLAQELGPQGICVNAVAPGVTATDRFKSGDAARAAEVAARTALGRIGEPEDIAAVVAWLCGPDAAWVTGEIVGAHGGLRGL